MKPIKFMGVMLFAISAATMAADDEWPQWRGPVFGSKTVDLSFSPKKGSDIKTAWKKEMGSGYSSISIANQKAVTMFSDGEYDYMIAFDAHTGDEKCRYRIDTTYKGSIDGPISTPVIDNETVYGLGPKGQLFACELSTGKEKLKLSLKQLGSKEPNFGWTTSPLVIDDLLICQTGGKIKNAISGINKNSGEIVWTTGDFSVDYQSPILATIGGQKQVISVSQNFIIGHEPKTGKEIWKFNHGGNWAVIDPMMVGDHQMFINYKYGECMLINIDVTDNYRVSTVWKNRHIKNTENPSVYHKGYIYGFSGQFLTCVDAKTGDRVWRSRQPGDGFLMMVNDQLVTITKKGTLHVADVNREGYHELSQTKLLEGRGWNPPSYAYGKIFVRNFKQIAAVAVGSDINDQMVVQNRIFGQLPKTKFGQFTKRLASSHNKSEMLERFMRQQPTFPIIEENRYVHVVYRGEVEDLAISGDMIESGENHPLNHVDGTDLHYYSFELVPNAHITYGLLKNYEENITDPLNPHKVPSDRGELSKLAMPNWKIARHLDTPQGPRGEMDRFEFESKILDNKRQITVYKPNGYNENETYSVIYFNDGQQALKLGLVDHTLDNLIGNQIEPVIAVFIENKSWTEIGGKSKDDYVEMIVSELIPYIDDTYPTKKEASGRAIMGQDAAGFNSIYTALKFPNTFGWAGGQSTRVEDRFGKLLNQLIQESTNNPTTQIYMDWGLYDRRGSTTNRAALNKEIFQLFKKKGFRIAGGEQPTGYDFGNWRTLSDHYFRTFFPLQKKTTTN